MPGDTSRDSEIQRRLVALYGPCGATRAERVRQLRDQYGGIIPGGKSAWDERDVVLITYADQLQQDNAPTLKALSRFLDETGLDQLINTVHLLPFFPSRPTTAFQSLIIGPCSGPLVGGKTCRHWPDKST